ncbi:MAG: nucleotidyltransferase family protein [Oscillospiraceae bacterium]
MKITGIVSEYNPFHLGHEHHIAATRQALGEDTAIVCAMSGNFVQRGEAAVFSKNARAEAAVLSGADLVLELPLPWALSSAEGFARGAVGLLGATGVVSHLSFGSECGDVEALSAAARLLLRPELDLMIREQLADGTPYALARQRALECLSGGAQPVFESPNNLLGIEYIRAIYDQRLEMEPFTVRRRGAAHDAEGEDELPSAARLRRLLDTGKDISAFLPAGSAAVFRRETEQGRGPVRAENLETPILSRLRMLREEDYTALPDAGEGLDRRLCRAARTEPSLDAVIAEAKTRRYALSRLRRMTLCAALGLRAGDNEGIPPYLRVLAAGERGLEVLRRMRERASLPVITKPADIRELDERARHVFELESAATDLYSLGFPAVEERRAGRDWRISPSIIRREDGKK